VFADLVHHDGKVLATWYLCGQPMALDPLSLETLGAETFLDTLRGDVMAHPKADERTGELMWFDYGAREPLLRYGVVGASGKVEHEVPIDLPGPRLPHDMAITENWSVLMDLPLVQDPEAARHDREQVVLHGALGNDERPGRDLDLGGAAGDGRERAARHVREQVHALERHHALDRRHRHADATGGRSRVASSSTRNGRSQARA
jgi:hypothetical protein